MRILIVHNHYQDWGGEDVVFTQEVNALRKKHIVDTLTFTNKKKIKGLVQFLLYPYNFWAAYQLKKRIKVFKPNLIHVHNTHYASGPIVFRVAQKFKIPVLLSTHNYRLVCPSALLFFNGKIYTKSLEKGFPWDAVKKGVLDYSIFKTFWTAFTYWLHKQLGTWKNINKILTQTNFSKALLLESDLGLTSNQVIIKPNFLKAPHLISYERKDHFLYVGRLSTEKGIKELIEGFKESSSTLRVIGDGPYRNFVEEASSIYKNIEYLGFKNKEEILQEMQSCKALLVPSICYEGAFPLTGVEALAVKTPLIISEIVAAADILQHNRNAILFNPYNFSDKIKIWDKTSLHNIGVEGYKVFQKNFSEEILLQKLETIYQSQINQTQSQG